MFEVGSKIRAGLENYDAVIVTGVDNFTYLSGVVLPFASNYPDRQASVVKTDKITWFVPLTGPTAYGTKDLKEASQPTTGTRACEQVLQSRH